MLAAHPAAPGVRDPRGERGRCEYPGARRLARVARRGVVAPAEDFKD